LTQLSRPNIVDSRSRDEFLVAADSFGDEGSFTPPWPKRFRGLSEASPAHSADSSGRDGDAEQRVVPSTYPAVECDDFISLRNQLSYELSQAILSGIDGGGDSRSQDQWSEPRPPRGESTTHRSLSQGLAAPLQTLLSPEIDPASVLAQGSEGSAAPRRDACAPFSGPEQAGAGDYNQAALRGAVATFTMTPEILIFARDFDSKGSGQPSPDGIGVHAEAQPQAKSGLPPTQEEASYTQEVPCITQIQQAIDPRGDAAESGGSAVFLVGAAVDEDDRSPMERRPSTMLSLEPWGLEASFNSSLCALLAMSRGFSFNLQIQNEIRRMKEDLYAGAGESNCSLRSSINLQRFYLLAFFD
jgi:hypothetical protein